MGVLACKDLPAGSRVRRTYKGSPRYKVVYYLQASTNARYTACQRGGNLKAEGFVSRQRISVVAGTNTVSDTASESV